MEYHYFSGIIWSVIVLFLISTSRHIQYFDNVFKVFDVHTCFRIT